LYVNVRLELWNAALGGIEGAFGGIGGKVCCLTVLGRRVCGGMIVRLHNDLEIAPLRLKI
jgi:hypothetical protein